MYDYNLHFLQVDDVYGRAVEPGPFWLEPEPVKKVPAPAPKITSKEKKEKKFRCSFI